MQATRLQAAPLSGSLGAALRAWQETVMPDERSGTFAERVLARLPAVRQQIQSSPEFAAWRDSHRSFDDGTTKLFLVGGDLGKDEEELMLDWARRNGLIDEQMLADAAAKEKSEFD